MRNNLKVKEIKQNNKKVKVMYGENMCCRKYKLYQHNGFRP